MPRIEKTVFISYRRTNVPWALAISQNLTHNGYDVFVDYTGVASGDFESVILENIRARAHFVVLLTPSALERCGDPGDWLRREIEEALDSKRNIVPLMLDGFDFDTPSIAKHLTGKIAVLKQYGGMSVPVAYFDAAMDRLRTQFLNVALEAVIHPASSAARQAATEQKAAVAAAPAVVEKELTAQQWFERGVNATDPDEEIRFNTEAVRLQPNFSEAYHNRALARQDKGDFEGAVEDYNEAIRLQPDDATAFNNRGNLRKDKGDLDGAIEDYNQTIRLQPDDATAFNNRGNVRRARGDLDGAIEDYNQAIRLQPDDASAFNNRGNVRRARGDLDGAIEDYNQAIRLKPDYATAFYNRGITRDDKGDLDGAIEDYNQAIRLKPDYVAAIHNRDVVLKAIADSKTD